MHPVPTELPPAGSAPAGSAPAGRPEPARLRLHFAELAEGQRDALDEIDRLVGRDVFGLALWRCRQREDAADVAQDVFLRLACADLTPADCRLLVELDLPVRRN